MNKLVIPAILAVTILTAGIFAFSPTEEASTVHNALVLSNSVCIVSVEAFDISVGADTLFDCTDSNNDGTITFTLGSDVDSAALVSLFVETNEPTDGGDSLTIDINTDGVEVMTAAAIDDTIIGDTELLSQFDSRGDVKFTDNQGPYVFSDTLSVDVNCLFTDGALEYSIIGIFRAPTAVAITVTETIPAN